MNPIEEVKADRQLLVEALQRIHEIAKHERGEYSRRRALPSGPREEIAVIARDSLKKIGAPLI